MLWTEILSGDFEKAVERSNGVCAMVVGCIEHHGRHLPLGQDVYHTAGVAELAAKREPFVLFPHMYFGEKQGAGEFKGTVIFSSKLMFDILTESCDEMARNGFKKIVLINGHGGNSAMLNNFTRSILREKKDYMVFTYMITKAWPKVSDVLEMINAGDTRYFKDLTESDIAVLQNYVDNHTASGHGDLMETAMTLGCRPDLVDMSRVNDVDGRSTHHLSHLTQMGFSTHFDWMSSYPNSLSSDAHDGNNERIGKAVLDYAADKMALAFKVLKEDTVCDEYHKQWLSKQ